MRRFKRVLGLCWLVLAAIAMTAPQAGPEYALYWGTGTGTERPELGIRFGRLVLGRLE